MLPTLDRDIDRVVRPLAIDGRRQGGQTSTIAAETPPAPPVREEPAKSRSAFDVTGTITGGGETGSGGAVVVLRRAAGKSPAPAPATGGEAVVRSARQFMPHLLALPVGAAVSFRNDGSRPTTRSRPPTTSTSASTSAGSRRPRCSRNPAPSRSIHAQMNGWVVAVDSPGTRSPIRPDTSSCAACRPATTTSRRGTRRRRSSPAAGPGPTPWPRP